MVSINFLGGKWVRLGLLGLVVFLVLVGVIYFYVLSIPPEFEDSAEYVSLTPFFVTEFREKYPDVLRDLSGSEPVVLELEKVLDFERHEIFLDSDGFSEDKFVFSGHGLVRVLNAGESSNLVVTSPDLSGESFIVSRVDAFGSGDEVVLIFFNPDYFFEVVDRGYVSIEETEDGLLVFEVSCTVNCDPENNYFQVFFAR